MEKYTGLQAKKSPGGELKLKAPFPTLDCEPEVPSITFRLHLPQAAPANLHLGKGQQGAEHAAPGGSHTGWVPWGGDHDRLARASVCWGCQRWALPWARAGVIFCPSLGKEILLQLHWHLVSG